MEYLSAVSFLMANGYSSDITPGGILPLSVTGGLIGTPAASPLKRESANGGASDEEVHSAHLYIPKSISSSPNASFG